MFFFFFFFFFVFCWCFFFFREYLQKHKSGLLEDYWLLSWKTATVWWRKTIILWLCAVLGGLAFETLVVSRRRVAC